MGRRYQNGSMEALETTAGPCWYIRFTAQDGKRPRFRVGLKRDYATEAKASRAAQHIRDAFNEDPDSLCAPRRTFGDVIARYENEEMPERFSTQRGYRKMHRLYIEPRWGKTPLAEVEAIDVRAWLKGLDHLSSRSKGHLHGQMKNLFKFAMLWKWMPAAVNPMSLFSIEGATKRKKVPRVISPAQFRKLLEHFREDTRTQTMVIGAYCLGLRASELFGLKWSDFDHLGATVRVQRAVVQGHVGAVKTERSNAPLPLAKFVGDAFLNWRKKSDFREEDHWVFASPYKGGLKPMDANTIQYRWLLRAGKAIGLDFGLGFHSLRHSYKSLLDRISADASLKRDLMRHADVHTTMQVYGEVEMDRLREANDAAVLLALTES